MKSKLMLAGGALTGVIALSTPALAGPLGVITGGGTGAVGFGGFSGGALGVPFGPAALGSRGAAFGAVGNGGAMASGVANAANMGGIGTATRGQFASDAQGAMRANPDALKSLGSGALRAGGRVADSAAEHAQAVPGSAFSEADSARAAALSARQVARGAVNAGTGTGRNTAAAALASGHEAAAAQLDSADDTIKGGTAAAVSARSFADAASSRLVRNAGNVSGSARGGASASAGAHRSGGSTDSVGAGGSADSRMHAAASTQ